LKVEVKSQNAKLQVKTQEGIQESGSKEQDTTFPILFVVLAFQLAAAKHR